jgi:hypothetical protein
MTTDTRETYTYWVCVDCYFAHHGVGDDDPAPDREPLALIDAGAEVTAGLLSAEHDCAKGAAHVHFDGDDDMIARYFRMFLEADDDDCGCERREFSWSRCDGCGSHLGGAREALTRVAVTV